MKRIQAALLLPALMAVACGSTVGLRSGASSAARVQSTASPIYVSPVGIAAGESPTSSPNVRAVLVDLTSNTQTYTVSLVDATGIVTAQVHPHQRTAITTPAGHAIKLPYVSTSTTQLYYLDGDSSLYRRGLDGSDGKVADLNLVAGTEATFAVSPDDSRMAWTVLDFNKTPVHVALYTGTLNGNSAPRLIFESNSNYVWPVAWHNGMLVLAHAYGPFEEDVAKAAPGRDNPYSAISYHVVDPESAVRKTLLGACTVSGPLSPAGSGCIQGGSIHWSGQVAQWSNQNWGSWSAAASLSPEGRWMAASRYSAGDMAIWTPTGIVWDDIDGPGPHDWAGWLDDETIILGSERSDWQPIVANVIAGGLVHPVAARGFYAARLPTDIV